MSDSIVLDDGGAGNWYTFDPLPVTSNLTLWFDAMDTDSLSLDASNYVTQWDDKSPNSYHSTQGTVANSPQRQTNAIKTFPGLYFDGTSDYLPINASLYYDSVDVLSGVFVCTVFRTSAAGNDNDSFIGFDRSDFWALYYSSSETVSFDFRA